MLSTWGWCGGAGKLQEPRLGSAENPALSFQDAPPSLLRSTSAGSVPAGACALPSVVSKAGPTRRHGERCWRQATKAVSAMRPGCRVARAALPGAPRCQSFSLRRALTHKQGAARGVHGAGAGVALPNPPPLQRACRLGGGLGGRRGDVQAGLGSFPGSCVLRHLVHWAAHRHGGQDCAFGHSNVGHQLPAQANKASLWGAYCGGVDACSGACVEHIMRHVFACANKRGGAVNGRAPVSNASWLPLGLLHSQHRTKTPPRHFDH